MRRNISYSFLLLILLGINFPVMSQTIHSDLKKMTESSDAVLIGKVVDQKSEWNTDKTRIYTKVTIKVDEYLKGSSNQSTITIAHPGGEVGEVGEVYSHVPRFTSNENVLLFVKKQKDNDNYTVSDGEAGKISLMVDPSTGEKVTVHKKKISAYKKEISSYIRSE